MVSRNEFGVPTVFDSNLRREVTRIGLGGEGILRSYGKDAEAAAVINRALELGIRYFDTSTDYKDSEKYLGNTLGLSDKRAECVLSSKTNESSSSVHALGELGPVCPQIANAS